MGNHRSPMLSGDIWDGGQPGVERDHKYWSVFSRLPQNTSGVYSLCNNISFNSKNLASLSGISLHILTILVLRLYGMDLVQSLGWQLLGSKYWFLSLGFLYQSVLILPSSTLHNVSKNGIASILGQSQLSG